MGGTKEYSNDVLFCLGNRFILNFVNILKGAVHIDIDKGWRGFQYILTFKTKSKNHAKCQDFYCFSLNMTNFHNLFSLNLYFLPFSYCPYV